jgi:hypothetical protein
MNPWYMKTQPLRRGRKYERNLDWCKQADTFIDRFGSILRHVDVKPAIRNPGISKTRRTMSRGNCTTCRLFVQVESHPLEISYHRAFLGIYFLIAFSLLHDAHLLLVHTTAMHFQLG